MTDYRIDVQALPEGPFALVVQTAASVETAGDLADELRHLGREDFLIVWLAEGESVSMLNEAEMAREGWVRA